MGVKLLESYMLGDMKALYFLDDEKRLAELMLLPAEMEPLPEEAGKEMAGLTRPP